MTSGDLRKKESPWPSHKWRLFPGIFKMWCLIFTEWKTARIASKITGCHVVLEHEEKKEKKVRACSHSRNTRRACEADLGKFSLFITNYEFPVGTIERELSDTPKASKSFN